MTRLHNRGVHGRHAIPQENNGFAGVLLQFSLLYWVDYCLVELAGSKTNKKVTGF